MRESQPLIYKITQTAALLQVHRRNGELSYDIAECNE